MDLGDFASSSMLAHRVTGNKAAQRKYYRHSTYPGGSRWSPSAICSSDTPR